MGPSPRQSDVTGDEESATRRAYLRAAGAIVTGLALAGCGESPEETHTSTRVTPGTPRHTSETTGQTTSHPTTGTTQGTERTATETTTGETTADGTTPGETTTGETTAGTRTATGKVDESRFETVVNVADAGADLSGEDPVNPVLDDHLGDDTLLYFPPGRYRLAPWEVVGYRNLGIVGDDASLVPPAGERDYWLMFGNLRDLSFAGFTLDCRATGVAPVNHLAVSGGTNVVRDVALRGHRRVPRSGFEIAATDPNCDLLLDNVRLPDGSTGGNGIFVFSKSVGSLTLRDCRIEHWSEGLYAAYHSGPLRVLGGYYANNGIDQVRVGGGHRGALVRGVTVRVDDPKQAHNKPNMRGIWMEEGGRARVRNCDVAITDLSGTYSSGAIVVGRQFGATTIENTRIRTDASVPAINVRDPIDSLQGEWAPSLNHLPTDVAVTCRNVRISGTATDGRAILTTRRNDCVFDGLCIDHQHGHRDGFDVTGAKRCVVRDSTIDVTGEPIRSDDATVVTRRVRTDGHC